jgi:hypothetical protein
MSFNQWALIIIGALILSAISPLTGVLATGFVILCILKPDLIRNMLNRK